MKSDINLPFFSSPAEVYPSEQIDSLNIKKLWDMGITGEGIKVGVLDTGIQSDHPFLRGKVVAKYNVAEGDLEDGSIGHGTHVSGIIAGTPILHPTFGPLSGIAPGCSLVNVKILDDTGNGSIESIVMGVEKAIEAGCHVLNLSLGRDYDEGGTSPDCAAIDHATSKGLVCCVAAGNAGPITSPSSPAVAKTALAVGALRTISESEYEVAEFSSRGPSSRGLYPDIAAPGYGIVSSFKDGYASLSGTSMATPHVTGTVALLLQYARQRGINLNFNDLKRVVENSALDIKPIGPDNQSGYGKINGYQATRIMQSEQFLERIPIFSLAKRYGPLALLGGGLILLLASRR